jgi:transposase
MKILAIDLGKYNSVACQLDTSSNQPEYETIGTHRYYIEQLLTKTQPELVVMETCSITVWVHDLCMSLGYRVLVANPS